MTKTQPQAEVQSPLTPLGHSAKALTDVMHKITGPRAKTHGDHMRQFNCATQLKQVLFNNLILANGSLAEAERLSPQELEAMNLICTKLSRIIHGAPNLDDWEDIIGYAALAVSGCRNRAIETEHYTDIRAAAAQREKEDSEVLNRGFQMGRQVSQRAAEATAKEKRSEAARKGVETRRNKKLGGMGKTK